MKLDQMTPGQKGIIVSFSDAEKSIEESYYEWAF